MVQVCILVHSPSIGCPVAYPFTVVFSTVGDSAGKHVDFSVAWVFKYALCLDFYFHTQGLVQIMYISIMWYSLKNASDHTVIMSLSWMTWYWKLLNHLMSV